MLTSTRACAHMNAWNSDWVYSNFDRQRQGFITYENKKTEVQLPAVGLEIRRLAEEKGASADSAEIVQKAREAVFKKGKEQSLLQKPMFGYAAEWLSELGKSDKLNSLVQHFDEHCNPTRKKGGLYYPRNEQVMNGAGEWTSMDPFSGNAAIGYARLNVPTVRRSCGRSLGPRRTWRAARMLVGLSSDWEQIV